MSNRDSVAQAIAAAAKSMIQARSLDETLQSIADAARASIPGFDLIGISTLDGRGVASTRAMTDDRVLELDEIQYGLGEGPCFDVLGGGAHVMLAPNIGHEQRWPRYVAQAVRLGLRSQMAVKLELDDRGTLGGINLYSTIRDDIDPEAEATAELFAVHAAIALASAYKVEHLNAALNRRKVIGQALGILTERYQMHEDRAFAFLVRASQHSNLKLYLVAEQLVDDQNRQHQV